MHLDTIPQKPVVRKTPNFEDEYYLATIRVEAAILRGLRKFFETEGFVEIVVPHLTHGTGSCENVDTVFKVKEDVLLAQTGQLYLEPFVKTLEKVCCISPSFRDEDAIDPRHLIEFPLGEIEFRTQGDDIGLEELMDYEEQAIRTIAREVLDSANIELKKIDGNYNFLSLMLDCPKRRFPKITYDQAIKELGLPWGSDLRHEHELRLVYLHTNLELPMFVTHYPKEIKFPNMKQNTNNPSIINSVDLIVPFGGEAAGGAERIHEVQELLPRLRESQMLKQLRKKGLGIEVFDWYINDMAKRESVPHAGCGFGMNRVAQYIMAKDDIRQVTAYPLNKETIL